MLCYCFSYKVYKARKQLAAIDWNFHLNQEPATTKTGEQIVTRKYNQRTKEWDAKIVKVKKNYEYIPVMMTKILHLRKDDVDIVTRLVSLNESDPALLAPTIADKPAPPSKELFIARRSRFKTSSTADQSEESSKLMLSQVNNSLCTSEESETDTLFKAESREMTPYSRKKQNY